jgi:hypothetical protein
MARSKHGIGQCSAVLEYIKSLNEVERETYYERVNKRTRKQNDSKRDQGILAREEVSKGFRKDIP